MYYKKRGGFSLSLSLVILIVIVIVIPVGLLQCFHSWYSETFRFPPILFFFPTTSRTEGDTEKTLLVPIFENPQISYTREKARQV